MALLLFKYFKVDQVLTAVRNESSNLFAGFDILIRQNQPSQTTVFGVLSGTTSKH